jgi:hypothetical protein
VPPEEPFGPRKLPVGNLTDDDFQQLCHRLVRLEFPDARSTEVPDGGADTLLPEPHGGWERGWQAKRYTGTIYWGKCKESLDRAVKTYEIARMTFCFARNLTSNQHKAFQKELVGRHENVLVDFWDLDELVARLDGSEEGRRVARHYFGDPPHDKEAMLRAFRAGGPLDTAEKAIERAGAVGEFLDTHDPFFSYPAHEFEAGIEMPLAPGAIMAVGKTEEGRTVRLDAVPRDADALTKFAPQLRLEFDTDDIGEQAAKAIDEAVRHHKSVTVEAGFTITAERLPPLFGDMVGKPTRARISLTPEPPMPWSAVFHAVTDRGDETLRVTLDPMRRPPTGWQAAFRGDHGGMTVTLKARWVEGRGGEIRIDWQHAIDEGSAQEQVDDLRFLSALHGGGELTIGDERGRPEMKHALQPRPYELEPVLRFLENVVVIENWIGEEIPLPEGVDATEAGWVATVANAIQRRAIQLRWEHSVIPADEKGLEHLTKLLAPRAAVRIDHQLRMRLLGRDVSLGHGVLDLPEAELRDLGPIEGNEAMHQIEVAPAGGEPLTAEWALLPPESAT